ncbi:MAG: acyl carrier protein [Eubacteriales bacterium]
MAEEKVIKLLADYKEIDPATVTVESTLADLKFDSLDVAEITMSIEDEFGITIEMTNGMFKTVGDIVKYIDEHQNA